MNRADHLPSVGGTRVSRRLLVAGAGCAIPAAITRLARSRMGPGAMAVEPTGSPVASPSASPVASVVVRLLDSLRFDPDPVSIRAGQTVTWLNTSHLPHTVTCDPAQNPVKVSHPDVIALPAGAQPFGSALLQPNDAFSHTFTVPGEYRYICIPHVLSGMRGSVIVNAEETTERD